MVYIMHPVLLEGMGINKTGLSYKGVRHNKRDKMSGKDKYELENGERTRTCILCGAKENMAGYICSVCQEKIQSEAAGKRREMEKEAERALKKYGVNPHDAGTDN